MHNICPKCNTINTVISTIPNADDQQVECGECNHTWTFRADQMPAATHDTAVWHDLPKTNSPSIVNLNIDNNIKELWLVQRHAIRTAWNKSGPPNHEKIIQRNTNRLWLTLVIAVFLIIGSVSLLFTARKAVVAMLPGMDQVYAAIGYPVNIHGLKFLDVAFKLDMENKEPALIINGKVVNIMQVAQTTPKISFTLFDKNRIEVYRWTEAVQKRKLAPNTPVNFSTKLTNPPKAHSVQLRFVNRQKR